MDPSGFKLNTSHCAGVKKAYWITCNVEPDIQHLSLDRTRFPSNFVVRPRDLNRLLANFQSSLQEITIIATEPNSLPSDAAGEIGGKAVELRSYIDPTKGLLRYSISINYMIQPWLDQGIIISPPLLSLTVIGASHFQLQTMTPHYTLSCG